MLNETNIAAVQKVAVMMLNLDLEIDSQFEFVVHHPFFNSLFFTIRENRIPKSVLLTEEENLRKARETLEKQIRENENYMNFSFMINKPYLPVFFKFTEQYLSMKDYCSFLSSMWVLVEFVNTDKNVSPKQFLEYFKKAKRELLMEEDDYKRYQELPDEITIYRGVKPKSSTKALSWTLSKKTAKWFADRFEKNGQVYQAKIKKENVLAYFNSRNEEEIIADFTKLYDIKKL